MALLVNLRHLEKKPLHLKGELSLDELDLDSRDEVVHVNSPLSYDLEVQQMEQAILVQGTLSLPLDCECVRCLKPVRQVVTLEHWACHIPLEGEEKAVVVSDSVDLTPYIREDIFLAFPQHPLCDPECSGLASIQKKPEKSAVAGKEPPAVSSPWAALDKLKL